MVFYSVGPIFTPKRMYFGWWLKEIRDQSKQTWLAGHEPEISNSFGHSEFGQKF